MQAFEIWLNTNRHRLTDDTVGLFTDSLRCLKNNIDRPAYLLAYQGLMMQVRDAILRADAPKGFSEGEWQKRQREVKKDNAWDDAVFNLIKSGPKVDDKTKDILRAAPIQIDDSVRSQFDFWRIQRNVCAHYKSDIFIPAHVVALYAFIRQWCLKISVEGGIATILSRIATHFDPALTPAAAPVGPLIEQIPEYVKAGEENEFIQASIRIVNKSAKGHVDEWLLSILRHDNPALDSIKEAILTYAGTNRSIFRLLIVNSPDLVTRLLHTNEEKRKFWYDELPDYNEPLPILSRMLAAGYIPDADRPEACSHILRPMYNHNRSTWGLRPEDISILDAYGFFDQFYKIYMSSDMVNNISHLSKICYTTDFYISLLAQAPLTLDRATILIDRFINHSTVPYTLDDRFRDELLAPDTAFRASLTSILSAASIPMPASWAPKPTT